LSTAASSLSALFWCKRGDCKCSVHAGEVSRIRGQIPPSQSSEKGAAHTSLNARSTLAFRLPRIVSPVPWIAAASPFTPEADSLTFALVGRASVAVPKPVGSELLAPALVE